MVKALPRWNGSEPTVYRRCARVGCDHIVPEDANVRQRYCSGACSHHPHRPRKRRTGYESKLRQLPPIE
jgi:hypothetical protein